MIYERSQAIPFLNELGSQSEPFFFFSSFDGSKAWIKPITQLDPEELVFDFSNNRPPDYPQPITFEKSPLSYEAFLPAFNAVIGEIHFGNSFLVNLTFKTLLQCNLTLQEIFEHSQAKYKVRYKDEFVVFSPETFVTISDGYISTFPMKGTIDASIPNAESLLLNDIKETAEHVTIVDLLRNDLSELASEVEVKRFRYVTEVQSKHKHLLQVSSEIRGKLPENHLSHLGDLVFKLLPAGSISGAPKPKTVQIIQATESYDRDFYTGVCGYFDGKQLDCGVMIRFIEKKGGQLYYKSGGGITSFSDPVKEYQEIIDKIYLPFQNRK